MMVDAIIAAMAMTGQENIPVVVTETGWPSETEAEAAGNYAEMYLKGLVKHLRSGLGTPLRKEGVAETYVYELFDEVYQQRTNNNTNGTISDAATMGGRDAEPKQWGIMYPNMTMKYRVDFSDSPPNFDKRLDRVLALAILLLILLNGKVVLEIVELMLKYPQG